MLSDEQEKKNYECRKSENRLHERANISTAEISLIPARVILGIGGGFSGQIVFSGWELNAKLWAESAVPVAEPLHPAAKCEASSWTK